LKTARQITNPSEKATALLRVAAAHARGGDTKAAKSIAGTVDVTLTSVFLPCDPLKFDYRKPDTWGHLYDAGFAFTMLSHQWDLRRAEELSAAAMTLAQALGEKPPTSYAAAFKDIPWGGVIRALARAHAAAGDPGQALQWARRIGSSETGRSREDDETRRAVDQRIHALIGVAEGIRKRQNMPPVEGGRRASP